MPPKSLPTINVVAELQYIIVDAHTPKSCNTRLEVNLDRKATRNRWWTEFRIKERALEERDKAIEGFQSYYRTLNHNQCYELRKWLTKALLNDLSLSQIEEITSRIVSASKGLASRQDKNRKPK